MSQHVPGHPVHRSAALVGRDQEMQRVNQALQRVQDGGCQLVLISGEPGIGKTRLLRDFLSSLNANTTALSATFYEDTAIPFLTITNALRDGTRGEPPGWASAWERIRHLIEPTGTSEQFPADQDATSRRIDALILAVQDLASERPVVLALDDAHWAGEPDINLLRQLLRVCARYPVLVLLSYRDTELGTTHALNQLAHDAFREAMADRIPLARLDEHGSRQLIGNVLDSPAYTVDRSLAQAIQQEAEGVPFFIEELVLHLYETGALEQTTRTWKLAPEGAMAIPQSIRAVVGHRVGLLSDPAQETLAVAAVIGNEFTLDTLAAVSKATGGVSELEVADHLTEAEDRSLVIQRPSRRPGIPETRYAFAHDQIRSVLHAELNAIRRRILHQAIGETLESSADAREPGYHAALAHHFSAGEDIERASRYSELAGDDAMSVGAARQAVQHYAAALEIHTLRGERHHHASPDPESREMRLLSKRELALDQLEERDAQRRDLERWQQLANARSDTAEQFRATDRLVRLSIREGDINRAGEFARELPNLACGDPDLDRQALIRTGEASAMRLLGDPSQLHRPAEMLRPAKEAFEQALARTNRDDPIRPSLLQELGIIAWELADPGDREARAHSRQLLSDALEEFRSRRDERGEVTALIALAYRRVIADTPGDSSSVIGTPFVGFLEEIRRLRSQEHRLVRESDRARNEARTALAVHVHCREFGIPERALHRGLDALNWAEAAGDRRIVFYALGGLSQTELALGRPTQALDYAERAMAIVESGSATSARSRALQWLGMSAIAAGQVDRGRDLLRGALEEISGTRTSSAELEATAVLARALAESDHEPDQQEALGLAGKVISGTDGMPGSIPWGVEAHLARARVYRSEGERERALVETSAAMAHLREREISIYRIRLEVPFFYVRSLLDLGRSDDARAPLATAAEILHRSAERIEDAELRTSFLERVDPNREIYELALQAGAWPGETPPRRAEQRPGGLSRREIEVLRLVAIGKTNRNISDELFISEKTVARHLTNIFTKIGTESRTQAAAWAYRNAVA